MWIYILYIFTILWIYIIYILEYKAINYFIDSIALSSCIFYYCQMVIISYCFAFSSFCVQLVEVWVTKLLPLYVCSERLYLYQFQFCFFPLCCCLSFKSFYIPLPGPMVIKPALIRDVVDQPWWKMRKAYPKIGGNPSVVNDLLLMAILLL